MADLRVSDGLWATSMLPEGVFEQWRVKDGETVKAGDVLAEITIEDALHDLIAPSAGRLVHLVAAGSVIEPGSLFARLEETGAVTGLAAS